MHFNFLFVVQERHRINTILLVHYKGAKCQGQLLCGNKKTVLVMKQKAC